MNANEEFGQILDDALAEFRETEPLAGIAERVMRRLRQQSEQRQKTRWAWGIGAVAVAALLGVAAWLGVHDRVQRRSAPETIAQQKESAPEKRAEVPRIASKEPSSHQDLPQQKAARVRLPLAASQRRLLTTTREPAQPRFPTPEPLTADERALLTLAQTNPQALQTFKHDDQEIAIAPLEIKPLADDAGSQGDY